jgi:hypothetical protein
LTPALLQPNAERPHAAAARPLEGEPGDKQHPSTRSTPAADERPQTVSTTEILAVIGGITLILTAAARIPAALAEFLRACILVVTAARELRTALARRVPGDGPAHSGNPVQSVQRTPVIRADDSGNRHEPPSVEDSGH